MFKCWFFDESVITLHLVYVRAHLVADFERNRFPNLNPEPPGVLRTSSSLHRDCPPGLPALCLALLSFAVLCLPPESVLEVILFAVLMRCGQCSCNRCRTNTLHSVAAFLRILRDSRVFNSSHPFDLFQDHD